MGYISSFHRCPLQPASSITFCWCTSNGSYPFHPDTITLNFDVIFLWRNTQPCGTQGIWYRDYGIGNDIKAVWAWSLSVLSDVQWEQATPVSPLTNWLLQTNSWSLIPTWIREWWKPEVDLGSSHFSEVILGERVDIDLTDLSFLNCCKEKLRVFFFFPLQCYSNKWRFSI